MSKTIKIMIGFFVTLCIALILILSQHWQLQSMPIHLTIAKQKINIQLNGLSYKPFKELDIKSILGSVNKRPINIKKIKIKLAEPNHKNHILSDVSITAGTFKISKAEQQLSIENIQLVKHDSRLYMTGTIPQLALKFTIKKLLPEQKKWLVLFYDSVSKMPHNAKLLIDYENQYDWQASFKTQDFHLSYPAYQINALFNGDGYLRLNKGIPSIHFKSFFGKINQQPFHIESTNDPALQNKISLNTLYIGKNKIKIGLLQKNKHLQLSWQFDIHNLKQMIPIYSGKLRGHGLINIRPKIGGLQAHSQLKSLILPDLKVAQANINIHSKKQHINFKFNANKIDVGIQHFKNIEVNAVGKTLSLIRPWDIRIKGQTDAGLVSSHLGLKQQTIQIFNINLLTQKLGQWHLKQPTQILRKKKVWQISKSCMQHHSGYLCLHGSLATNHHHFFINSKRWPISILKPWLPDTLKTLEGNMRGFLEYQKISSEAYAQLKGDLKLQTGKFVVPFSNQKIDHLKAHIYLTQKHKEAAMIHIDVATHGKPASIKAKGFFAASQSMPGQLIVDSENMLLLGREDFSAWGAPHLIIKHQNNTWTLNGKIHTKKLFIALKNQEQNLPNNTIIVGQSRPKQSKNIFNGNILIDVTKPIKTNIMNTSGFLSGEVNVHLQKNKPILATGKLKLKKPKHNIFSKVKITKVNVLFQKSPITQPNIDISLSRILEESWQSSNPFDIARVVVGINIYGPITSPKLQYFSTPTKMTNDKILASLLAGHQTNAILPSQIILLTMGLLTPGDTIFQVTNPLKEAAKAQIVDSVQFISDARTDISTDTNIQDTSLLLTKKINNWLHVNYQFGLMSEHYQLSLNAQIRHKMFIQIFQNEISNGINLIRVW